MEGFSALLDWFAGQNRAQPYMNLYHCMGHDTLWVAITVVLDVAVAVGYGLIALHWWRNQRNLVNQEARRALGNMRNIFVFCGICGYIFIPIKMFWPAWRLYDIFLLFLVFYTWRYAWNARDLKVIYRELGRSETLRSELESAREDQRRRTFFLNAVSHDLKNPMCGLALQTQVAQVAVESGDRKAANEALEAIHACTHEARQLLDDFLELARLDWNGDGVHKSRFDCHQMVRQQLLVHEAEARGKGIELLFHGPSQLMVSADRNKLERVVANLIQNAIKYTRQGHVRVVLGRERRGLVVDVIDTGPGIPIEHQQRLFDEFYQIENPQRDRAKGFGLGLAIARRLAEQMGGQLELESELGRGSRFSLILPDAVEPASEHDAAQPAGA